MRVVLFIIIFSGSAFSQTGEVTTSTGSTTCGRENAWSIWGDSKTSAEDLITKIWESDLFCDYTLEELVPARLGQLPTLWSQQLIGSDLSREFVASLSDSSKVRIANVDQYPVMEQFTGKVAEDFDRKILGKPIFSDDGRHATAVLNLLAGKRPYGISENTVISQAYYLNKSFDSVQSLTNFEMAFFDLAQKKNEVVNIEIQTQCELNQCDDYLHSKNSEQLITLVNKAAKNSLIIMPSGNFYPDGQKEDKSSQLNAILVGNLNPYGMINHDSNEGDGVVIAAPAAHSQATIGPEGHMNDFGGTSGATPMVSAALADAKSILGELSLEQAKVLLRKTAVSTPNSWQNPQVNGAGMLNAFKLMKVAVKLKNNGWPINAENLLQDESNFNFNDEAVIKLEKAKQLLKTGNCEESKRGFNFLRESFFLNQSSESVELLISIYSNLGYEKIAQFYRNLDREEFKAFVDKSINRENESTLSIDSHDAKSIRRAIKQLDIN